MGKGRRKAARKAAEDKRVEEYRARRARLERDLVEPVSKSQADEDAEAASRLMDATTRRLSFSPDDAAPVSAGQARTRMILDCVVVAIAAAGAFSGFQQLVGLAPSTSQQSLPVQVAAVVVFVLVCVYFALRAQGWRRRM